jgi:hypothetical protein
VKAATSSTLEARAPKTVASPAANTSPSSSAIQYPLPDGVAAMPTMSLLWLRTAPWNPAEPKAKMPPSAAYIQYPAAVAAAAVRSGPDPPAPDAGSVTMGTVAAAMSAVAANRRGRSRREAIRLSTAQ